MQFISRITPKIIGTYQLSQDENRLCGPQARHEQNL